VQTGDNLKTFQIAQKRIGPGHPAFIIAEVGQAHDGSLGTAHAYIDAIAETGADAVKFQTHIAAHESTVDEPFRVRFSMQDQSRFAYWQRMEFKPDQWAGLAEHARERGMIFLSSPFSVEAVHLLRKIGMPAWKLGSGEFRSMELLDAVADAGGPVLLSTGMSRWDEIGAMVDAIGQRRLPFALFQCASRYPTPLEEAGLNLIEEMRRRFGAPVGLSDHSGQVFPGLAALARGVHLLEVHVIVDRRLFGPDSSASLTIEELALLVKARNAFERMDRHPADKDEAASRLHEVRGLFTKSIALARHAPAGTLLSADLLVAKKPGTGIPFTDRARLIGRRLKRDVCSDRLLKWEDFDDPA
jgi:N-acetylneuraminate synthase